jgi:DNA-binding transcriptional MerR regulator
MGRRNVVDRSVRNRESGRKIEIPNKLFFRIGEVCKLIQLEPYVLRFWETEFPMLSPAKGANGRRMYRKKDVELLFQIRDLLYKQGFTIVGAKKVLGELRRGVSNPHVPQPVQEVLGTVNSSRESARSKIPAEALHQLKSQLRDILTMLNRRC